VISAFVTVAALALSLTVPATVTTSVPAKGPGPRGEYASGQIIDTAQPGFCITAPQGAKAGDPVLMAQCVKGDAFQLWYCVKFEGLGNCSLLATNEALDIGQGGKSFNVSLVDPDKGVNYLLHFLEPTANVFNIVNPGYKGLVLGMPRRAHLNFTYRTYWLESGSDGRNVTYRVTFQHGWKPNPV
jgi:hypothetical protein